MAGEGGGVLPDFFFSFFFPVQQTTSGIGHRVKCTRGGYETAEVRVVFGELARGAVCVGVKKNSGYMGCFLDDLRIFGINADQWTTAAQDDGEWRRTAEQGAGHFMAKWIAAARARTGLWDAVVCPNVTGRIKKTIAQSKRARDGSLAIVD